MGGGVGGVVGGVEVGFGGGVTRAAYGGSVAAGFTAAGAERHCYAEEDECLFHGDAF